MIVREKLIHARLGMLALADELQDISSACRRAGISRKHGRVKCRGLLRNYCIEICVADGARAFADTSV